MDAKYRMERIIDESHTSRHSENNNIPMCLQITMKTVVTLIFVLCFSTSYAQPGPGDVFREYIWFNSINSYLRVGGDLDYGGHFIFHGTNIDLVDAIKVEVVVEKLQSHEGTKDLEIDINDKGWIAVPISEHIKKPQASYMHNIYPVIPIPLSYLNYGFDNKFRLRVNPIQEWDWPQNLIYGVHFRVYYDPDKKAHPTGEIVSPTSGGNLGESVQLKAEVISKGSNIKTVQFIGNYEDVNYEGDGIYRQWHYHYKSGTVLHHLGSAFSAPYTVNWNTTWVPDQIYPMEIAARIVDQSDMIYFTDPVSELQLDRTETSVVLLKPYDISPAFVTRKPDRKEKFFIRSDMDRILAAQMVWTSWSSGHMKGIFINENHVFENEGPLHAYYFHRINLSDMNVFNQQENILTTGQSEAGHHGMEVQWPGIMHLLKVDFSQTDKTAPLAPDSVSVYVSETGLRIDWNDLADNEKGFIIERKSENGSYSVVGKVNWAQRTYFIDSGSAQSTKYIYRVSAFNDYGSSPSEEIPITSPAQKAFLDFSNQSQYMIGDNWINENGGFYYLYDFKGVNRDFGVLKPVYKRPYTSAYLGKSFSCLESKTIGQTIYIKSESINLKNVDALNFGLISVVGDELDLDSSDSSFIAISLNVPKDQKTWGMSRYNKISKVDYEIADSTLYTFFPDPDLWYKLSITWEKTKNDSIAYQATLDEYEDGALFLSKKDVLTLSGKISNASINANDNVYAAIVANSEVGLMPWIIFWFMIFQILWKQILMMMYSVYQKS